MEEAEEEDGDASGEEEEGGDESREEDRGEDGCEEDGIVAAAARERV